MRSAVIRRMKRSARIYGLWQALNRTRIVRLLRRPRTSPRALRRHARAALREDRSYAGEGAHLRRVLERCGLDGGYVVDLAAGDGVTQSCTLFLFRDPRWRGLAVEMDERQFRRLAFAYRQFPNARVVRSRVSPDSVESVLGSQGAPTDFEVLNLDLDSYDLSIAEALLRSFRPLVVSMEVNEKVPPPVYFTVLYHPEHVWRGDHFYGCSLVAAAELLEAHGYVLESLHYNNAFFVKGAVAAGRFDGVSVEDAYDRGYRRRPERREIFPWNHDVEDLQELPPEEVVRELHERFRRYSGRFVAEVHPVDEGPRTSC